MILSMTGYGKAENQLSAHKKVVVELRSLNSKSMDLSMRLTPQLRSRELEIRTLVSQRLERGKVDLSIYYQDLSGSAAAGGFTPINREAFAYYYNELSDLQTEYNLHIANLLESILRIPDVLRPTEDYSSEANEQEWQIVLQTLLSAIDAFTTFRAQEGDSLERMFREKLDGITALLAEVEPYEKSRVEKIRTHLLANLEKLSEETKQKVDRNRLEQEMIYYLEKLDITEEKVRLTNHIRYFHETLAVGTQGKDTTAAQGVGKKLGFIAQEMGREINTLGSKSNQSEMQIIVVRMKDILEQIKEQVLNVL